MENSHTRRRLSTTLPPSPHLLRSRSTSTGTSPAIDNSCTPNYSGNRSKSTTKSRINKNEENINPSTIIIPSTQKKQQEKKEGFGKFLSRGSSPRPLSTTKGTRSVTNSPSAWALSPGRPSLGCSVRPESPRQYSLRPESPAASGGKRVKGSGGGGGGVVSGVLKYFKQKKVSSVQEEEFHRFRVLQNRLLQWRFVNARAETTMVSVNRVGEAKLFSVWIRILKMRNSILQKRLQMQKFKLEIKLHQIIKPQMFLLNEWAKLEKINQESISRMARKLTGLSVSLPVVQDAKADVESIYEAMSTAIEVMDSIEEMISKYFSQIETILYLVTELKSTSDQEDEYLEELEMAIALVAKLLVKEKSVQVHLIQAAK